MQLVIQSTGPLEIGRTYCRLHDPRGIERPMYFVVVRVATSQQWVQCMVTFGEEQAYAEMLACLDPYFYEIETD